MATEAFNLDSLLEDLHQATKADAEPATIKFYPHRPTKERSPNQVNPKAKFAVIPDSSMNALNVQPYSGPSSPSSTQSSPSTMQYNRTSPTSNLQSPGPRYSSQPAYYEAASPVASSSRSLMVNPESASKTAAAASPDDYSIDNILSMLTSPVDEKVYTGFSPSKGPSVMSKQGSGAAGGGGGGGVFERFGPGYSDSKDTSSSSSSYILPPTRNSAAASSSSGSYSNSDARAERDSGRDGNPSSSSSSSASSSFSFPSTSASSRISASVSGGSGAGSNSYSSSSSSNTTSSSSSSSSVSAFPSASVSSSSTGGAKRCTRVVIAGATHSRGIKSSAFSKCACDNLRCLQCNFRVHQFANCRWSPGNVDYMFFRNNVPNEEKLETKLARCEDGSYSYCCQCSWIDSAVEKTISANGGSDPQWICGGHP